MVAVVPVKGLDTAKTRLRVPEDRRRGLALAFALDTVAATLACAAVDGVVVVSADPAVASGLAWWPVRLLGDPGGGLAKLQARVLEHSGRFKMT